MPRGMSFAYRASVVSGFFPNELHKKTTNSNIYRINSNEPLKKGSH